MPRDPRNGYRLYGPAEIGRLPRVIRMLLRSGFSTMAVLRMLLQLDQGYQGDLRQALDTPRPDEDMLYASDRWLTTLADMEQHARQALDLVSTQLPLAHQGCTIIMELYFQPNPRRPRRQC